MSPCNGWYAIDELHTGVMNHPKTFHQNTSVAIGRLLLCSGSKDKKIIEGKTGGAESHLGCPSICGSDGCLERTRLSYFFFCREIKSSAIRVISSVLLLPPS